MTSSTAHNERDDDIVRLAFAILDEESRSWVHTPYRGNVADAYGAFEANKHSEVRSSP